MLSINSTPGAAGNEKYALSLGLARDSTQAILPAREILQHTMILDDGFMRAQQWENALLQQHIRSGGSAIIFDQWATPERANLIAGFLRDAGRGGELRIFDMRRPDHSDRYSPTLTGNAGAVAAKLVTALEDELSASQTVALQAALSDIVMALRASGMRFTLREMALLLQYPNALAKLEESMPAGEARQRFGKWSAEHAMNKKNGKLKKHMVTLAQRLSALAMGEAGELVNGATPTFNFADLIESSQTMYIALPRADLDENADVLAGMMLHDIAAAIRHWSEAGQQLDLPYLVFLQDTARRVSLSPYLLGDATAAGVGFVGSTAAAEADKDQPGFMGDLLKRSIKLLSGSTDYALASVTDFLGVTEDATLVVRGTVNKTMQLVNRPTLPVGSQINALPARHEPLSLLPGDRMLDIESMSGEFARQKQVVRLQPAPLALAATGE